MKRLNYHHLYYFWRIAVVGKLTDVATELHISQSALSAQLKQFEDQVGLRLFTRQNRQLILTEEGKKVLDYAEDIFSTGNELEHWIKHGLESNQQRLSIGIMNNLSRNFIDTFIAPLLTMTSVSVSLETRGLDNLIKGLTEHTFDLALTNCVIASFDSHKLWQTQMVGQQPIAIVGPRRNAKKQHNTFPSAYDNQRWILPGKQTEIRSAFESWCAIHHYRADVQAETNDMAMLRLLARDSGAIAVLPPIVVKDEIAEGLLEVYEHIPNAFENFYAISANKKRVPALLNQLLQANMLLKHI